MMDTAFDTPSREQLISAHKVYAQKELRGTDEYWNAVKGVEEGFRGCNAERTAKAMAIFLKSWNKMHYRFNPAKADSLISDLAELVTNNVSALESFRSRSITTLACSDGPALVRVFESFCNTLLPVGTAKALNLTAPFFFPLWDNPIAGAYGVVPSMRGYISFMFISKYQVERLPNGLPENVAPLKLIDEYNYCKYTKGWAF